MSRLCPKQNFPIFLLTLALVLFTFTAAHAQCHVNGWELGEFCGHDALDDIGVVEMNHDCITDFLDRVLFNSEFGLTSPNLSADLNGDGTVNGIDVQAFDASYFSGNPVDPCVAGPETSDDCAGNLSLSLDPVAIVSRGRFSSAPGIVPVYLIASGLDKAEAMEYGINATSNVVVAGSTGPVGWSNGGFTVGGGEVLQSGLGTPLTGTVVMVQYDLLILDQQPVYLELVDNSGSIPPRLTRWAGENLLSRNQFLVRRNLGINGIDPVSTSGCQSMNNSPTLVITDPPSDIYVTSTSYDMEGSAADPDGSIDLDFVEYRVNDGAWFQADGEETWNQTISLVAGENWVQVRTADLNGAYSSTQVVSIHLVDLVCHDNLWPNEEFCGHDARMITGEFEMNHDCVLDFLDYCLIVNQFGDQGSNLSGDFNGDTFVNATDLQQFTQDLFSGDPVTPCDEFPENLNTCSANLSLSLDPNMVVSRGRIESAGVVPVYLIASDWIDAGAMEYALLGSANVTVLDEPSSPVSWDNLSDSSLGLDYYIWEGGGFPQTGTTTVVQHEVLVMDTSPATLSLVDYAVSAPPRLTRWAPPALDVKTEFKVRRNLGFNTPDPISTTACPGSNSSPTLAITDPPVDIEATTCTYDVLGFATDPDGSIAFVEYRVNDGPWLPTTGTDNWMIPLSLEPGENWIQVRAADDEGGYSSTQAVSIDNPLPTIVSIVDVENDQGRQVRMNFLASARDALGSPTPILQYEAFRRIDPLPTAASGGSVSSVDGEQISDPAKMGGWEFVGAIPAHGHAEYNMIVPTLADETDEHGIHWSVFFVRAATAQPLVFFDSCEGSGYSIDNLPPSVPTGLLVAYAAPGNQLEWEPCPDEDFRYFRIYRGSSPDFVPDPENPTAAVTSTDWLDTMSDPWNHFYKITAVDQAGNESPVAVPTGVSGVDDLPPGSSRYALHQCVPNPFNPLTRIKYELPEQAFVKLNVYTTDGRLVTTLVNGQVPSGTHEAVWTGKDRFGRQVAAGVYFCNMEAAEFSKTIRMVLVK